MKKYIKQLIISASVTTCLLANNVKQDNNFSNVTPENLEEYIYEMYSKNIKQDEAFKSKLIKTFSNNSEMVYNKIKNPGYFYIYRIEN